MELRHLHRFVASAEAEHFPRRGVRFKRDTLLAIGFSLALGACGRSAPPAMPPAQVTVLTVAPEAVAAPIEFVGQAEASKSVEVRSQVTGIIVDRPYIEGTDVRQGAVLFRIDPTTYEAAYRSAQAQLLEAQARQANADRNLTRFTALLADHAIAQKDADDAETEAEQARAGVEAAQGILDQARKNFDDTYVRAQISGRAGIALMVLGARVTGPGDLLTTVEQVNPVYVNFSPSDQDVLRWRRDIASKRIVPPRGVLEVQVTLADGSVFAHTGKLNFVDLALQPGTGSLQLRAQFPNPEHTLLPGQFVRIQLLGLKRFDAILVPQRAVLQGLNSTYVLALGAGDTVSARNVTTGQWLGGRWIIESGLQPGDRVVVDGVQKAAPGRPVTPMPYNPATDSTLAAPSDSAPTAPPSAPPRTQATQ